MIALFLLPKLLVRVLLQGKYRASFFARIRPQMPEGLKKPLIWLHGASLGEIKALSTLVPQIKKAYPDTFIFITTVTETGRRQANKSVPDAGAIQYLPLDFSWIIRPFVQALRPELFILVEGDYWYNLMREVKNCGGSIVVVNGKLSEKSVKRYLLFSSFSHNLFSLIDYFCLQRGEYLSRFLKLGVYPKNIVVTGNLKLEIPSPNLSESDFRAYRESLGIAENDVVVTLGSTHDGEEKLLLNVLCSLQRTFPNLKVLLLPRHPERFPKLRRLVVHYPRVILVDRMGILPQCYHISDLAIVGGSFVKGVGGHDVFEPVKMGVPTLFGPFMYNQKELVRIVTESGAGKSVSLEALHDTLEELLSNKKLLHAMGEKGKRCAQAAVGPVLHTWAEIEPFFQGKISSHS